MCCARQQRLRWPGTGSTHLLANNAPRQHGANILSQGDVGGGTRRSQGRSWVHERGIKAVLNTVVVIDTTELYPRDTNFATKLVYTVQDVQKQALHRDLMLCLTHTSYICRRKSNVFTSLWLSNALKRSTYCCCSSSRKSRARSTGVFLFALQYTAALPLALLAADNAFFFLSFFL